MTLRWNEIKECAVSFSKEWENTENKTNYIEYLFEVYEQYTADLFTKEKKKK